MATLTSNFLVPTSAEITEIDPVLLDRQLLADPMIGPLGLFPIKYTDADMLVWEQRDSYNGLMQFRGLNGEPPKVQRLGSNLFRQQPGAYGEFELLDEEEMTRRAQPATWFVPIKVDDLTTMCHNHLMVRQNNRMRWIVAQLLTTGAFVVLDKDGAIGHVDSYKIQIYTASITWATVATATPLANLRAIPILGRGQSTNFGAGAEAWMTQATFNNMLGNTNIGDLRGERLEYGQTVKSLKDVNLVLTQNNLPTIRIYEDGYQDTSKTWHTFLPDNMVAFVGKRMNNQNLGEFRMTKNLAAPNGLGVYDKVVPKGMEDNQAPPPRIEVHRGFNGGPVLYFPGAIFIMMV